MVFFAAGLIRKIRLEEKGLTEIFPDYAAYKAAVPALIPFIY
jgi:protein-S-isoprenylcysteine O-methyltransferase Ste14